MIMLSQVADGKNISTPEEGGKGWMGYKEGRQRTFRHDGVGGGVVLTGEEGAGVEAG